MIESAQSRVVHLDNARYYGEPRRSAIDTIIVHTTMGHGAREAMQWDNRPNSPAPSSYHYVIDRDGTIFRVVPVGVVAWHAGESALPPVPARPIPMDRWVNHRSIGVAFAGDIDSPSDAADPKDGFLFATDEQLVSGYWLVSTLMQQNAVGAARVLGHREVAPGRKFDPRPGFLVMPWFRWCLSRSPLLDREELLQRYSSRHIWTSANTREG